MGMPLRPLGKAEPAGVPAGSPGPLPEAPAVEARDIWKRFASTQALRAVDLRLEHGKCLGLVGRNGAGKSTLVSILSGIVAPDRGSVSFEGKPAPSQGDAAAWHRRIATVYQHSMVVPWLTVAENVFLGRYPTTLARGRRLEDDALGDTAGHGGVGLRGGRAGAVRRHLGGAAPGGRDRPCARPGDPLPGARRAYLCPGALGRGTLCSSASGPSSAAGVAVLYISHHLEEVFEICDSVAVLRDGEMVLTAPTGSLDKGGLVAAMVGGATPTSGTEVGSERQAPGPRPPRPRLVVKDVSVEDLIGGPLAGVSLEVRAGEVLGVTGLRGSGATTIGRVVAGAVAYSSGQVQRRRPRAQARPARQRSWPRGRLRARRPARRGLRASAGRGGERRP